MSPDSRRHSGIITKHKTGFPDDANQKMAKKFKKMPNLLVGGFLYI